MEDKKKFILEKKQIIKEIKEKYKNTDEIYAHIVKTCDKVLMSRDKKVSLYGMFLPDKRMEYCVTKYQGKLTTNPQKMNYKYYFDDKDRVILTERHYDKLVDYIFYFYEQDCVNIVWYSLNREIISTVARLRYVDKELYSFFEAKNKRSFDEYIYEYQNNELNLHWYGCLIDCNDEISLERSKTEKYKLCEETK